MFFPQKGSDVLTEIGICRLLLFFYTSMNEETAFVLVFVASRSVFEGLSDETNCILQLKEGRFQSSGLVIGQRFVVGISESRVGS